jgi:hypothetical protein
MQRPPTWTADNAEVRGITAVTSAFLIFISVVPAASFAQSARATSADPCGSPALSAAADALAAKFDDHQFLFLGSTHGDAKSEEFLACLVTRPAFCQRATDIVTEWASSGHQQLLDRHVLKLEPAPADPIDWRQRRNRLGAGLNA